MNYPVWELHWAGGGLLVAMIAVFHVYISHFAVGGGLFLVLSERLGLARQSDGILAYAKRNTRFFMLVTMVLGGITGVGIWFIISLLAPAATTYLIHTFVFAWAIEWAFFLGEIVTLFVYYYYYGKMDSGRHMTVGWVYFAFGWMSLFMINGIIGFMLTPGDWLQTKNIWDGFFNPTFWPSLAFRTCMAFMIAGLYGFVTATWEKDREVRETMVRYCALWLAIPFALLLASGWWYLQVLPPESRALVLGGNPELTGFARYFVIVTTVLLGGGLFLAIRMPAGIKRPVAVLLLIIGLMHMGIFEMMREAGRRPYLIQGFMYSNSILAGTEDSISAQGYLASTGWSTNQDITDDNLLDAGHDLFLGQCSPCHSVGGPLNDIRKRTADFTLQGMEAQLTGQGKIYRYMPPFVGTELERSALAAYIVRSINNKPEEKPREFVRPPLAEDIPPFDGDNAEYVLLAWNTLGEKCITDCDSKFTFLYPGNTLGAQLIHRGELPEIVTEGVTITYTPPAGFEHPSQHSDFWKYAPTLVGKVLDPDVGATGLGMSGDMTLTAGGQTFMAAGIPVLPYNDDGSANPYPVFTIEARNTATGEVLARTKVVAPVSTGVGCRNCHGGEWKHEAGLGISVTTANDILARHDRHHKTGLNALAASGKPVMCQSCHPDPLYKAPGIPELVNLPTALHGFHANYLPDQDGGQACHTCHPTNHQDLSYTSCDRGLHSQAGITCDQCHGTLEDHALSLLKNEHLAGKPATAKLMRTIRPRMVASVDDINPRVPWKQEPDCLTCHVDFAPAENGDVTAFNTWTESSADLYQARTDDAGLHCLGCHSAPHAEYPAVNAFHPDLDNLQPLQYQHTAGVMGAGGNCAVCHTVNMEDEFHHANIFGR